MRLYKDKILLNQAVAATARYFKADPSIVEKDYYASVLLKRLSGQLPGLLLTGGASLSKCYRVINRFSDDIDLTLMQDPDQIMADRRKQAKKAIKEDLVTSDRRKQVKKAIKEDQVTADRRKQMKNAIKEVCLDLGFSLLNEDEIKIRRDFNRYEIDYSPKSSAAALRPVIHVDTYYSAKAPAYEIVPVSSMIYEYMKSAGQDDFIRLYKLQPFTVNAQTMTGTLIDKIFDLCDAYLTGRIPGHSYMLYDISRMIGHVPLDDGFAAAFQYVRAERAAAGSPSAAGTAGSPSAAGTAGSTSAAGAAVGSGCFSADESCDIPGILSEILDRNVCKRDYDSVTAHTLFDGVSYEEAAAGVKLLAESGLLDPLAPQPGF